MNKLKNNVIMILFAVILLSSTLTIGTQNNVNKLDLVDGNRNTDQIKIGVTHPMIQIAEATSEEKMQNEMRSNVPYKSTNQDSEIKYYDDT
jgi:antitoxin component YwqK of YwqJK toxin-antitoxin module